MKPLLWITMLLATASSSFATIINILDPGGYGGSAPGAAANNGDVKGLLSNFDVEKLVIDTGTGLPGTIVTVSAFLNFNGGVATTAGGYLTQGIVVGGGFPTLYAADVLISNGASKWAIPLTNHVFATPGDAMLAGHVYSVPSFKDSMTVVGFIPGGNYNPFNLVHGQSVGAVDLTAANAGGVTALGGAKFQVDMLFITADAAFMAALGSGVTTFEYNSATCANDLLSGGGGAPPPPPGGVPEPASLALLGAGLAGLGLYKRRKQ